MSTLQTESQAFMPHGMCYLWEPELLWTHVVSDALIAGAYFAIPAVLAVMLVRSRADLAELAPSEAEGSLPYSWVFLAFALFILACGTTHALGVWTVWNPDYWLSGGAKAVTAVASVVTAVALPPLVPRFTNVIRQARLSAQRRRELEAANVALRHAHRVSRIGTWQWTPGSDRLQAASGLGGLYGVASDGREPSLDDLIGRLGEKDGARLRDALERASAGEDVAPFDVEVDSPDGTRTLDTRVEPRPGEWEQVVIVTQQDVTDARRAEMERRQLVRTEAEKAGLAIQNERLTRISRRLEERNRELDRFAYIASHDLKAPLRGVANLAHWLEEDLRGSLTDETREYLELMQGRVDRMEALIEGLLTYSRVGRHDGSVREVDTGRLVRDVLDLLALDPELEVVVAEDLPSVRSAELPLQQVFQNLLENASHHADGRIEVGWRRAPEDANMIEFHVADDGHGIAPRHQEQIWEIFQRLESRDAVEGTGLGLALVRKIVDEAGGRAWLESTEGEGATFFFSWPIEPREENNGAG